MPRGHSILLAPHHFMLSAKARTPTSTPPPPQQTLSRGLSRFLRAVPSLSSAVAPVPTRNGGCLQQLVTLRNTMDRERQPPLLTASRQDDAPHPRGTYYTTFTPSCTLAGLPALFTLPSDQPDACFPGTPPRHSHARGEKAAHLCFSCTPVHNLLQGGADPPASAFV
jgi:hypothetical protein